jgi:hypothetical protein
MIAFIFLLIGIVLFCGGCGFRSPLVTSMGIGALMWAGILAAL